nr:agamous-like MADS-box protein AGL82 [Tanacetum cinerariifolium]
MVGARRMELIASDKKRELTFQGRVKGMKKKAYELSTFCGLDIGMIICSPSGQIETLSWPKKVDDDGKTLLDLIASYKNQDDTFASNNDTSCHSNIPSVITGGYPMISQVMIGHAAFQDSTYNSNDAPQYTNDNGDQLSYNPYLWRTPY